MSDVWRYAIDAGEVEEEDVMPALVDGREVAIYRVDWEFFATADRRGLALTGADATQAAAYDAVVGEYLDYRLSAFPALKALCADAPDFAMAQLLKGYLLQSMGTGDTLPMAPACHEQVVARADALTARERLALLVHITCRPLEAAAEALEDLRAGRVLGRVVLRP